MALKSVIDIDVNDAKFKEFLDVFNKYKDTSKVNGWENLEIILNSINSKIKDLDNTINKHIQALKKIPQEWSKISQQIDTTISKVNAFSTVFEKQKDSLLLMPVEWKKAGDAAVDSIKAETRALKDEEKAQKDVNKAVNDNAFSWKGVFSITAGVVGNLISGAVSLAKWLTIGGLLTGYGLNKFAAAVGADRTAAKGLGVSIGELTSAKIHYKKYGINPQETLDTINKLRAKGALGWVTGLIGQDANKLSNSEIVNQLVLKAGSIYSQAHGNEAILQNRGALQFLPYEAYRALAATNPQEVRADVAATQRDVRQLNISDRTAKALQDFDVQISKIANTLKAQFAPVLAQLTPQLTKLTNTILASISHFLRTADLQAIITNISARVEEFTKYLASEQFKQDIDSFAKALRNLADFINALIDTALAAKTGVENNYHAIKQGIKEHPHNILGGVLDPTKSLEEVAREHTAARQYIPELLNKNVPNIARSSTVSQPWYQSLIPNIKIGVSNKSGSDFNVTTYSMPYAGVTPSG